MEKKEYLNTPIVKGFVEFFQRVVNGQHGSFNHEYVLAKSKKRVKFISFEDAYRKYDWNDKNLSDTQAELKKVTSKLERAIASSQELDCLVASLKILEWGGEVYRGSAGWLADIADDRELVQTLKSAINILNGDDDRWIGKFGSEGNFYRSNSGMTKVYSLASQSSNSIIYDDRVGAALALITKEYLQQIGESKVPSELAFMRGNSNSRNPSDKQYKFPRKITGKEHALSNLRANWIIKAVVSDSRFNWVLPEDQYNDKIAYSMRAIEAALFMIGYASNGDERSVQTTFNLTP